MQDVPAAILAGGLATRLRPITQAIPKALVDVAGRPFIDHQLELLSRSGIRKVVLCLGHLGEQIEQYLGDGSSRGLEIRYSYDGDSPAGTGGAIRWATPMLGDAFWVMYGDSYMDIDYRAIFDHFAASDVLGLMTLIRNDNQWDTSNAIFRDGKLLRYDKQNRSPEMNYIDYGVHLLRREVITRLEVGARVDLADLYRDLVAEERMIGFEVSQRFYEIGTPKSLDETRRYLQERDVQSPIPNAA
jgi:NDP-sugar pyrophosphorylase family protein